MFIGPIKKSDIYCFNLFIGFIPSKGPIKGELYFPSTPGSMNSLFSDLFKEFWRGILGGVRDYLGEVLVGF